MQVLLITVSTMQLYQIFHIKLSDSKFVDKHHYNIYDLINLLDGYPIIQLVDCDGNTLLHKAVYKNNYSAVKFLIMKGIDLSIKNNQGVTALEIAVLQNRPEIETLLRSAGAK